MPFSLNWASEPWCVSNSFIKCVILSSEPPCFYGFPFPHLKSSIILCLDAQELLVLRWNQKRWVSSLVIHLIGFVSLPCTWLRGGWKGTGVQRCPPNHLHFGAGLPILPWFFLEASVRGSGPSTRGRSGSKQRTDKTASAPKTGSVEGL